MSLIVIQQMIMIFILITIGIFLFRTGHLDRKSSRDVSWIVVNVTNPITILVAALEDDEKVSIGTLGIAFLMFVLIYVFLGIVAYFLPIIMGVKKDERYSYRYMSVFSNVGFIGIPFCSAVLGIHSLIFVSICSLIFNLIAYTYGIARMRKIGQMQHPENGASDEKMSVKDIINTGTVFSVLTILIYILDFPVPQLAHSTLSYIGRATTFLSMIVLGTSVAQVAIKDIFGKWRLYVFTVLRQILVPIILIFILRPFIANELMLKTAVIMVAMPCANLPLMMAKQYDVEESTISSGIILTTLLSIITIPLVTIFM